MKKQYIYPQNMRTKAKLWFWTLKDLIIISVALTISVIYITRRRDDCLCVPDHTIGGQFRPRLYQAGMAILRRLATIL